MRITYQAGNEGVKFYDEEGSQLSASEILALLLTVDGSGSGLDADLLDGLDSLAFLKADGSVTLTDDMLVTALKTIDGRDISVDGTKLDGIETSATADQTDAEIETAYNNQVPIVTQVAAEAGTAATRSGWTAERVKQAIAALSSGSTDAEDLHWMGF